MRQFVESLQERVGYEMARSKRYGIPLCVVLLGPLQEQSIEEDRVATIMKQECRRADVIHPLETNRVLAVLPHTPAQGALGFAKRMRENLAQEGFDLRVSVVPMGDQHTNSDALINQAMATLRKASADEPVVLCSSS